MGRSVKVGLALAGVGCVVAAVIIALTKPRSVPPAAQPPAGAPTDRPPFANVPNQAQAGLFVVPLLDSPTSGPATAPLTVVLFGDFADPESASWFAVLQKLHAAQPDAVRWVFKSDPAIAAASGPQAMDAALLAVVAAERGKFEPLAAALFADPGDLGRARLAREAERVGVSPADLSRALTDPVVRKRVIQDRQLAATLGVQRPPALFLNGRRFEGRSEADLAAMIQAERDRAQALLSSGVPAERVYDELIRRGRRSAWLPEGDDPQRARARPAEGAGAPGPKPVAEERVEVAVGTGPFLGPRDAPVRLVIFAALTCPFCAQMIAALRELQGRFPAKLQIALRQIPARGKATYRDAELAIAAAAGSAQGWALVEKIYGAGAPSDRAPLLAWAREVGIAAAVLQATWDSPAAALALLAANQQEADRVNARGMPHLFVQGRRIPGATAPATLERLVREELDRIDKK